MQLVQDLQQVLQRCFNALAALPDGFEGRPVLVQMQQCGLMHKCQHLVLTVLGISLPDCDLLLGSAVHPGFMSLGLQLGLVLHFPLMLHPSQHT